MYLNQYPGPQVNWAASYHYECRILQSTSMNTVLCCRAVAHSMKSQSML